MTRRCPTQACTISPHGGYHYWRPDQVDPKSGKRGVMHWAWDLSGPVGTPVYAPESGYVVEIATGASSPWTGYQPGLVLILGASGYFHVLGHLDYARIKVRSGQYVSSGDEIGPMGIGHTHWQIQKRRTPDWGCCPTYWEAHGPNTIDPAVWLAQTDAPSSALGAILLGGVMVGAGFLLAKILLPRRVLYR